MNAGQALAGRVAIVTGGARGIGLAVVEELHRLGAAVLVADSGVSISGSEPDSSVAQTVAAKLGGNAAAFTEDMAATGAADRAVKLAVWKFGALDIVVNNAAILRDALIFKASRDNWEQVIANNLTAPFALLGLTRVVAMDMARSKVACNAIAPFAATRVTATIQPANEAQAAYKERALRIPAHYVARLTALLCSNAHDITGQVFGVRGRELFLFSQARPVARTPMNPGTSWGLEDLAKTMETGFAGKLTDLGTDLEFFNTEPLV